MSYDFLDVGKQSKWDAPEDFRARERGVEEEANLNFGNDSSTMGSIDAGRNVAPDLRGGGLRAEREILKHGSYIFLRSFTHRSWISA